MKNLTVHGRLSEAIAIGLLDIKDVLDLDDVQYDGVIFTIELPENKEQGRGG